MKAKDLHLDDSAHYRISTQGRFDADWLDMLSGNWVLHLHQAEGDSTTILVGEVADQAALLGALQQLYCLGFPLLVVERIGNRPAA